MEIYKVKDYKKFSEELKMKTGCQVSVQVIGKNHFHYQLSVDGMNLGVLCIENGEATFAPFVGHETARNDNYLNLSFLPLYEEFTSLLAVFKSMFVED